MLKSQTKLVLGAALDAATAEARYFDLALLPWDAKTVSTQDMAQSLVFGSGVPVILVPQSTAAGTMVLSEDLALSRPGCPANLLA